MNNNQHDIEDNQIRIIRHSPASTHSNGELVELSECSPQMRRSKLRRYKWVLIIVGAIAILAAAAIALTRFQHSSSQEVHLFAAPSQEGAGIPEVSPAAEETAAPPSPGYTTTADTTIQGQKLTLLTPHNATPRLLVGPEYLSESGAVLILQAADVRGDNKAINCAFVQKGQLLARGRGKAGYCAILDGKINIGTATYTPLLEECIERGGDFFRQYPLVAGSSRVSNTRKSKSYRRALAQIDGKIVVVFSHERMSLDSFADLLVGLGADEAIYLVGSTAFGSFRTKEGNTVTFGNRNKWKNLNFIAWY